MQELPVRLRLNVREETDFSELPEQIMQTADTGMPTPCLALLFLGFFIHPPTFPVLYNTQNLEAYFLGELDEDTAMILERARSGQPE